MTFDREKRRAEIAALLKVRTAERFRALADERPMRATKVEAEEEQRAALERVSQAVYARLLERGLLEWREPPASGLWLTERGRAEIAAARREKS